MKITSYKNIAVVSLCTLVTLIN